MRFFARLQLALDILRGRVTVKNETVVCAREHVEAGEVRVKAETYNALRSGDIELGVLRGAVATLETAKYAQLRETVASTVANVQRS